MRPDPALPDLSGQVVLVTGAGGLLGSAIAARMAQAGAAVVAHYRNSEKAIADLVQRITQADGEAIAVRADLNSESGCQRIVRTAADWRGRLDTLVSNAGIQPVQDLPQITASAWRQVADACTTSAFCCTQAAARIMGRSGGGSIIMIASIEGTQPAPGHAHYSAAKAAMIMLARSAALEYGPAGIRVNAISPGLIDRPGLATDWPSGVARWQQAAPLTRLGRPQDIADACVFLASPLASWITGHNLTVDGGISARPTW
jgi:NAD(P)-dependent dehydrogenase (short-subunit alcohol dehydrogenase family)